MTSTMRFIPRILVFIAAFGVLVGLGLWQLQRRDWKNALISRLETAISSVPYDYEPPRSEAEAGRELTRVRVSGIFQPSGTFKVLIPTPEAARAKTREGFGYQIFTPLKFAKGVIFVNRGFVPQSLAEDGSLFPAGEATVSGIVRLPQRAGSFTPEPDLAKKLFYSPDIEAMAAAAGIKQSDVVTAEYIQAETPPGGGTWPMGVDERALLAAIPNRHLEYALTWFALAGAFAAVSGIYVLRSRHDEQPGS